MRIREPAASPWPITTLPATSLELPARLHGPRERRSRWGKPQVIYNGHPLDTFSGDKKAGDTTARAPNAFGGLWYVVSPTGTEITSTPSTSGGSGGSSGSPGY